MSEPQGGTPAARTLSKLPGVLVVVGAGAVLVGTLFLPWMVGDATRFLSNAGESSLYASVAFFGVSIVGGIIGLMMLPRGSNARLALIAILWALLAGSLIYMGYEAFSRRVARLTAGGYTAAGVYTSVGWKVAVGPAPYVSGVGAMVSIIGGLVGFPRRGAALAAPVASASMLPLTPGADPPTPPAT
jgi:hypothetical protein